MLFFTKRFVRNSLMVFPFLFIFTACDPALRITGMDISSMYSGQKENSLQISQLYNLNDSISALRILIPAGLILPDPGTKKYTKKGRLKYEVIGAGKSIDLIDSATFEIADTIDSRSYISHSWAFRAPAGLDYFVKATYTVPGIQDNLLLLEYFSKKNHLSQSWFRFQSESGDFLPGNTTSYAQPLRMVSENKNNLNLQVKFYSRIFPSPMPPFAEEKRAPFNYTPDSTFNLAFTNGQTAYFTPEKTGFYFFQPDTTLSMQGPTLFRMNNGFPKITMHSQMRDALLYITSAKEFKQLNAYKIPKLAVDSFWIANAGREDLATELIRKYYSRIEIANKLYTSFTDGWNTDRGMIYIMFGKPSQVFRSFEQEIWIYGEYNDPRALKFYFNKARNPFTNNDYVLIRSQNYTSPWYQNVQLWRR